MNGIANYKSSGNTAQTLAHHHAYDNFLLLLAYNLPPSRVNG